MKDIFVIFKANLILFSQEAGGRTTPICSGFRTDIKFNDEIRYCSLHFKDIDMLMPGETTDVEVKVLLHGNSEIIHLLDSKICNIYEGKSKIGKLKIQTKVSDRVIE